MQYSGEPAPQPSGFFSQLGLMVSGAAMRAAEIAKNAGNVAYNFVGSTVEGGKSMLSSSTPATPASTVPSATIATGATPAAAGGRRKRTKKGGKRRTHRRHGRRRRS